MLISILAYHERGGVVNYPEYDKKNLAHYFETYMIKYF